MEAVTFGLEAPSRPVRVGWPTSYGTIVVVGGGCYGSYYVRQLERALDAGAICWESLLVVDRDPSCAVAAERDREPGRARYELVVADWDDFFRSYLRAASERADDAADAIVPSPLMPHLLYDWLLERARERWPGRSVEARQLAAAPSVPWNRAGANGTHYVSFADWMCPVNCVEPRRCPHTRGERTWSLPAALEDHVALENASGRAMAGPVIFHCTHRAFGVGMIDAGDVIEADRFVTRIGAGGPVDILVGTVSHCHGALNLLSIGSLSV